jgi:hypothetical protein
MQDSQSENPWVDMLEMRIQVRTGSTMPNGQHKLGAGKRRLPTARVCIGDPDPDDVIPYSLETDPDDDGSVQIQAEGSYRPRADTISCYVTDAQGNQLAPDDGSLEFGDGSFSATFTLKPPASGDIEKFSLTVNAIIPETDPPQVDATDSVAFKVDFTEPDDGRARTTAKRGQASGRRESRRTAQKG